MSKVIVTGGSGFLGGHVIKCLLEESSYEKIINVDFVEPEWNKESEGRLHYINADIRESIDPAPFKALGCGEDTVVFNLAAICKIPGFPTIDYFRTNIRGAETTCALAETLNVKTLIFTSTISTYGASEELKTEETIPQPDDAYGSSKLAAEYIHRGWQQKRADERNLVILRPGIIFGENEQANFVRLYQSLKKGFFAYPGRKDTRKACIYVKDAARACVYFASAANGFHIFNLVYPAPPTIETICKSLAENTDAKHARFTIPGPILNGAAHIINIAGNVSGKDFNGIHPDRVRKVMISTNVSGEKLDQSSFSLNYSLDEGIREWYQECNHCLF